MVAFERTVDWEAHYEEQGDGEYEAMKRGGANMADRLDRVLDPFPESVCSVGCGLAFTLGALADTAGEFVGVDPARTALRAARERARHARFVAGALPELPLAGQFGCVYSYATLHYVADAERAVAELWERVAPGGTLVVHYPNRFSRRLTDRRVAEQPGLAERFELVLDGVNLLSQGTISDITGRPVHNFWLAAGEDDWRDLGRTNACVYVEKPA